MIEERGVTFVMVMMADKSHRARGLDVGQKIVNEKGARRVDSQTLNREFKNAAARF